MEELVLPSKADLVDAMGRPITQSLFLEIGYSDHAVFTLKEDHYEYNGKVYPSLKRLFIEMADPTEYEFANKYLLGWRHWKRMDENKRLHIEFEGWREELHYKLRSQGISQMIAAAKCGSVQAARWLAEKGYDKRQAGRPSKEEVAREIEFEKRVANDYGADVVRLFSGDEDDS